MTKIILVRMLAICTISLSLISCGGSSDTSDTRETKTGVFIDSPVVGLKYKTNSYEGYTNNKGEYQYKEGEAITFYLGNLKLGRATGQDEITPLTICGDDDLNNISTKATNIARVLQTLDHNSSDGTTLLIPDTLRELDISSLDLESEADLNTLLQRAQNKTSRSYILKNSYDAKTELEKYIGSNTTTDVVSLGACKGCHGANWERAALGKSKIVKDMTKEEVSNALVGYKRRTYGGAMKGVMIGQTSRYSENALRNTGIGK